MWSSKPVPLPRYEAILQAIELTDKAMIDAVSDEYAIRKLLLQRLRLVEALAEDEDVEEEDEKSGPWKCEACGQTGDSETALVEGFLCPACNSARIMYNAAEET